MGLNIYLDSCLIIYIIEEHKNFAPIIEQKIIEHKNRHHSFPNFCASSLSKMESLIVPFRNQNLILVEKFENWFDFIQLLEINKEVFQKATQLRADFPSLKTPDALHLATAIYHNCDEFWTNDNNLDKVAPNLVKNIL